MSLPSVTVVDQDEYIDKLYKIIEKDYFPELKQMKEQTDNEIQHSFASTDVNERKHSDDDIPASLHLDEYQSTHMSEDSYSFQLLMEEQLKEHRRRYKYAYSDTDSQGTQTLHLKALPAASSSPLPALTDGTESTALNRSNDSMSFSRDSAIVHREFRDSSQFLVGKQVPDTLPQSARLSSISGSSGIAGAAATSVSSKASIARENTRLPSRLLATQSFLASHHSADGTANSASAGKEGLASGTPAPSTAQILQQIQTPVFVPRVHAGAQQHTQNSPEFTSSSSTNTAETTNEIAVTPLITWGTIAATPTVLSQTPSHTLSSLHTPARSSSSLPPTPLTRAAQLMQQRLGRGAQKEDVQFALAMAARKRALQQHRVLPGLRAADIQRRHHQMSALRQLTRSEEAVQKALTRHTPAHTHATHTPSVFAALSPAAKRFALKNTPLHPGLFGRGKG